MHTLRLAISHCLLLYSFLLPIDGFFRTTRGWPVSPSNIVWAILAGLTLATVTIKLSIPRPPKSLIVLGAFIFWIGASVLWAPDTMESIAHATKVGFLFVQLLVCYLAIASSDSALSWRRVAWGLVLGNL